MTQGSAQVRDVRVEVDVEQSDVTAITGGADIECECMLCHLPLSAVHGPVEWRLTVHFPGPYPAPGEETMLLCTPCYEDWRDNAESMYAIAGRGHRI